MTSCKLGLVPRTNKTRSQAETEATSAVMKVILTVVLLVEVCLGVEKCTETRLYQDLSLRVVINGTRATADIDVKKCHQVKSIHVDHGEGGFSFKCGATMATNSYEHFVCGDLPLDMRLNLTVTISGSDEYINMTIGHLFTTDVQSVTVEPDTTTASVTCILATGNMCQGCHVRWRDADGEGGEDVAYKMGQNSLTASTTIGPLVPGHTYNLAACDVESDGSFSDVKFEHLFETKSEGAGNHMLTVAVSVISPVILLCMCVLFCGFLVRCYRLKGQVSTNIISKLQSRRKDRTARDSEDQDLEDILPPPPIPPRTMDMYIPATVSSTTTAGTESTTMDDAIVTDVCEDDGTTGTPPSAHCHMITFTAMNENVSSENTPSIPPRTNEMYLLEHHSSKRGTLFANCFPSSDDQTRDCFISEARIAEEGSDTESMSAWNEDANTCTEVDNDMQFPDDTISETSWDIGFPPPIPRRTQDMFLVQNFDPSNHTTVQIAMMPNNSYTKLSKTTV